MKRFIYTITRPGRDWIEQGYLYDADLQSAENHARRLARLAMVRRGPFQVTVEETTWTTDQ